MCYGLDIQCITMFLGIFWHLLSLYEFTCCYLFVGKGGGGARGMPCKSIEIAMNLRVN